MARNTTKHTVLPPTTEAGPQITSLHGIRGATLFFTVAGVLVGLLLGALDQTIVTTALPRIVSELGGLEKLAWVITAYMVSSTTGVPIWGKLSDMFGRKWFYVTGILIFLVGSALCGLAQDMFQLILFRTIQGIGAGVMFSLSFIIIGDLFSPAERGKWQGLFGAAFGLASIIGPTLGGYLTDELSWRWVFYVNLPVGAVSLAMLILYMPALRGTGHGRPIDYAGVFSLIATIVPLLLALSLGGKDFAWMSPQVLSLLAVSLVMLFLFIYIESRAAEPLLPLGMFRNGIFSVSVLSVYFTGMGMFGSLVLIPLFVQGVVGTSATNSGVVLTPLMLSMVCGSVASGQLISRTGRYKLLGVLGPVIMTTGMFLLTLMDVNTSRNEVVRNMVVVGVGLGITFPVFLISVQNSFPHSFLGVSTSSIQFFRSIGGTIGVAIFGSVLANQLASELPRRLPQEALEKIGAGDISSISRPEALVDPRLLASLQERFAQLGPEGPDLFHQVTEGMRTALATSLDQVFLIAAVLVGISIVVTLFLKEMPLRKTHDFPPPQQEERR